MCKIGMQLSQECVRMCMRACVCVCVCEFMNMDMSVCMCMCVSVCSHCRLLSKRRESGCEYRTPTEGRKKGRERELSITASIIIYS